MTVDLAAERLNRGLSIRQLAEQAELTAPTVTRAEQGEAIHPNSAKKLADFYGFKVTEIWPLPAKASA